MSSRSPSNSSFWRRSQRTLPSAAKGASAQEALASRVGSLWASGLSAGGPLDYDSLVIYVHADKELFLELSVVRPIAAYGARFCTLNA